jgi:SAM-dependent methyltransferase/uncharacterized protein YbaR (Trm112 family)
MRQEFLSTLHCPYSGSMLTLVHAAQTDEQGVSYGVVSSEAGEFPIVAGILRLQVDEYRTPIVEHVRRGRMQQALTIALDEVPFQGRTGAAINLLSRVAFKAELDGLGQRLHGLKRGYARRLTDDMATFVETAERLSPGPGAEWQIYRFSMPTFLPTFPLLHALRADGPILDFSCGTGQASFLMARMWPQAEIVCADYSLSSLYVAKKYFAPRASYVCLDGDYLLPFESGRFASIFSSDALHCIDSKLNLAQEFQRIGRHDAVLVMPHLHNRLASVQYGKSLTPDGYSALFKNLERRVIPEDRLVHDYFFNDTLDLSRQWSAAELAAAQQGLSLVASADPSVFVRREGLWKQRISSMQRPLINPVYQISGRPGGWQLKRRTNGSFAKTLSGGSKACVPETLRMEWPIDAEGLANLKETDPLVFGELARSLVVLDLPDRFQ